MPRIHTLGDVVFQKCTEFYTASSSGTGIDCLGYGVALLTVAGTASGGSTIDVSIQESTDNATWTNVASSNITQLVPNTVGVSTLSINLSKRSRYLRAVYVGVGNYTAANIWSLCNPVQWPVSQTNTQVKV